MPHLAPALAPPSRARLAACAAVFALATCLVQVPTAAAQVVTPNPILFVTQNPVGGFTTVTTVFGNHRGAVDSAPRGGDLVLRYGDGSLRFLTAEAGYGDATAQGADAIAVREPCVHWSGQKALFSMVVGAPSTQYQVGTWFWQIYEVTGLGVGETAVIRKIDHQPLDANNVSPIYATDDRILFVSDRPVTGAAHHYPQRDEYESTPIVAGIYALDEATGDLEVLEHSPSGVTSLSIDSFGRVIFTKWDHLQRDQQGDAPGTVATYQSFTYASEAADAATTTSLAGAEVFPEPRTAATYGYSPDLNPHSFNHFFPWEINEDGTAEETLNHVGRHELGGSYTDGNFADDPNLSYFVPQSLHANDFYLGGSAGLFHLREDPTAPGDFLATHAPEFATASGGVLLRLTGAPNVNPEDMTLTPVTPSSDEASVPADTGYFRNPLPLGDGSVVAVHTAATGNLTNAGSTAAPDWTYDFRLTSLVASGNRLVADQLLTGGIVKNLTWWTPDQAAAYNGPLWELDPVEVVARTAPAPRQSVLPAIEAGVFAAHAVDVSDFRNWLRENELALIVGRNVTQRDRADRHQPFNLNVPGGVSSIAASGTVYDVSYLQIFQADALRGYGTRPGRRLLARPMHAAGVSSAPDAPPRAVRLGLDGSFAAIVPARRALTWQLAAPSGEGVVRERNWLSFQAGEIRVCTACHGINTESQTGATEPENEPQALHDLLLAWLAGDTGATECASGIALENARLKAGPDPFKFKLLATAVLPEPWVAVDPTVGGIGVAVAGLFDQAVAGGESWKARGKRWVYSDRTGAGGPIRRAIVVDRRHRAPGTISLKITGAGPPSVMPDPGAVSATVRLGTAEECAAIDWAGPGASGPHCRTKGTRLDCRPR
jgi:hypothetical protein